MKECAREMGLSSASSSLCSNREVLVSSLNPVFEVGIKLHFGEAEPGWRRE